MTKSELIRIAKKASCRCSMCHCLVKRLSGAPVFGNGTNDCKIDADGNEYCSSCAVQNKIDPVENPSYTEPDRIADDAEKARILSDMEFGRKYECYAKDGHVKYRFQKEDESPVTIFVYGKRKKNRGYRMSVSGFLSRYDLKAEKPSVSENERWHKRIDRAIKCLTESGLWSDILPKLRNLSEMNWDDRERIYQAYMDHWNTDPTPVYNRYLTEYPFVFRKNEDGKIDVDTFYIYEISDITLKSMYFGKYQNEAVKELIKHRIEAREDYSITTRTSYDVRFEYDAENNKAWYSEEYKGCGNGHYWIALNHSTAMFCEND